MPYTLPTADALQTRYPNFAAVADATITAAILEASASVDTSWEEADYQPAIMALAAHTMAMEGLGEDISAQLKGFRSLTVGPLRLERDSGGSATSSGWDDTVYGSTFAMLLQRNRGGARVAYAGEDQE